MKYFTYLVMMVMVMAAGVSGGIRGTPAGSRGRVSAEPAIPRNVNSGLVQQYQQGSDIRIWLSNYGPMGAAAWGLSPAPITTCPFGGIGLEHPVGTCVEHLYGAGPAIGGTILGTPVVSQAYNTDNGACVFYVSSSGSDSFHVMGKGISDNDVSTSCADIYTGAGITPHVPMGIRIIQKSYAWNAGRVGPILPMEYEFINIGTHEIDNVYLGIFTDPDVGPLSDPSYGGHNYSAYLPAERTAYSVNPVDAGSTPVGLTILRTPMPIGTGKFIWQCYGFNNPGMNDSVIYQWMSGAPFGGTLIGPDQRPDSLTDTKYMFSFGPVAKMMPGDTLTFVVAFIGADSLSATGDGLQANARTALLLYKRGYTVPDLPVPKLAVTAESSGVVLRLGGGAPYPLQVWDDSNQVAGSYPDTSWRRANPPSGHTTGGRIFGGYRIYRAPISGAMSLLKECVLHRDSSANSAYVDTMYIDSTATGGQTFIYKLTAFSIPDRRGIESPTTSGSIVTDTVYGMSVESPGSYDTVLTVTAVNERRNDFPPVFSLRQNYPDPFNPSTVIEYTLPTASRVSLKIYDVLGRLVGVPAGGTEPAGVQRVVWNASAMPSGIYFYRLEATSLGAPLRSFTETRKMIFLK